MKRISVREISKIKMKQINLHFLLLIFILTIISFTPVYAQKADMDSVLLKYFEEQDSILRSKIGTSFVDFCLTDLNGNQFTEKQLIGKVTLINFWFEGCAPCVAEFDDLNDLYDSFKDNFDFQFLSITFDYPEEVKESITKYKQPYTIYITSDKECQKLNFGQGYPTTIIVDKQGKIRLMKNGGYLDKEKITAQIDSYKQEVLELLKE